MPPLEHYFIFFGAYPVSLHPIFSDNIFSTSSQFVTWQSQLKICLLLPTPNLLFLYDLALYSIFIMKNFLRPLLSLFTQETSVVHLLYTSWPYQPGRLTFEQNVTISQKKYTIKSSNVCFEDTLKKIKLVYGGREESVIKELTFDLDLKGWNGVFEKKSRELSPPGFSRAAPRRKRAVKVGNQNPRARGLWEVGSMRAAYSVWAGGERKEKPAGETERRKRMRGTVGHFTVWWPGSTPFFLKKEKPTLLP